MSDHPGPGARAVSLLVGLLCLLWGSTWMVIREGLEDLPPFLSAAVRFTIAALLMAVVASRLAGREGGARPTRSLVLMMGVFNFAVSYGIVYWVEQYLPSALTSVLWAIFPLVMAILSHLFLPAERIRPLGALGFLLGFAGVTLLFLTDVRALGADALPAAMVLLVSPLVVAFATLYVKKHGEGTSSLRLNRDAMFLGAALLWVVVFLFERDAPVSWSGAAVASVAYLSVVGTVVTFGVYFWLLRFAPAYKLSVIPYLTPAVALALGAFVAGEPVGPMTLVGMGMILAGVLLVSRN